MSVEIDGITHATFCSETWSRFGVTWCGREFSFHQAELHPRGCARLALQGKLDPACMACIAQEAS